MKKKNEDINEESIIQSLVEKDYKRMIQWPFFIARNECWFAEWQWRFYKWFGITRKIPCGQRKKEKWKSCALQRIHENNNERLVQREDGSWVCKVCGRVKIRTSPDWSF